MSEQAESLARRIWRIGPLIVWLSFIFFASTNEFSAANTSEVLRPIVLWFFPNLSESKLAAIHFLTRKAGHFTEYAILAFLARRTCVNSPNASISRRWFSWSLFLVVSYALLDEFHQSFVPSRTASIYDSGIDIVGGLTLLLVFKLIEKRSRKPVE